MGPAPGWKGRDLVGRAERASASDTALPLQGRLGRTSLRSPRHVMAWHGFLCPPGEQPAPHRLPLRWDGGRLPPSCPRSLLFTREAAGDTATPFRFPRGLKPRRLPVAFRTKFKRVHRVKFATPPLWPRPPGANGHRPTGRGSRMGRGVGLIFRRQTFCPDTCPPSASQLSHENVTSASSLAGRGDGPARASQPHAPPRSWALQGEDVGYGGRQGGGRKVPVPRVSCAVRRPPWAHESDTCPAWHWPLESHMPRPPVLATCEVLRLCAVASAGSSPGLALGLAVRCREGWGSPSRTVSSRRGSRGRRLPGVSARNNYDPSKQSFCFCLKDTRSSSSFLSPQAAGKSEQRRKHTGRRRAQRGLLASFCLRYVVLVPIYLTLDRWLLFCVGLFSD